MAEAPAGCRRTLAAHRQRLSAWWLRSPFQRTWLRLAVQVGVCCCLIMTAFSTPAAWELHTYDPVLANPVMILVISNLGLLFTAHTGLPALKIGVESVVGSVAGGVASYAVVYLAYWINGGTNQPTPLKAAMLLLFGSLLLALVTASRYRWPQYVALSGLFFNLTLAVAIAVTYYAQGRLWRFVLYWWWFVGLSFFFSVGVATVVLPLPAGWVVRKQLAKALRQEGALLEAIVRLMAAEDPAACNVRGPGCGGGAGPAGKGEAHHGMAEEDCDEEKEEEEEDDFPEQRKPLGDGAPAGLAATLRGCWACGRRTGRRVSSLARMAPSLGRISLASWRSARGDTDQVAKSLGICPRLYAAVEPIYSMSGPTAASIQAAHAHMRFVWCEVDLYRPTHRFPSLPFHRLLLLARTLMSALMLLLYPLQTGDARLSASRRAGRLPAPHSLLQQRAQRLWGHAGLLQATAGDIKACCRCLAAVLRDNAPVRPALQQLDRLERTFWRLQQAVGGGAAAAASKPSGCEAAAAAVVEALQQAETAGAGPPGEGGLRTGAAAPRGRAAGPEAAASLAGMAGTDAARDSLALHLTLSMLFTCCTRVRAMYQLLPDVVAADQPGVGEAVAAHFAAAHAWDAALQARTRMEATTPVRGAEHVCRRSQELWAAQPQQAQGSRGDLARPQLHVAQPIRREEPGGWRRWGGGAMRAAFAALQHLTGFSRSQLSLGIQMAVAFAAVMLLVIIPAVNDALSHRSVWAVFIAIVVHEPLMGSVIWKCVLRFGGTLVAGILGLGSLYFSVLCNGLSFDNHPAKFISMTAALTLLSMPLAAGVVRGGPQNAYFWIVSCLLMYTVALPGYAHDAPMPVLALWRVACTAIGIAIELLVAVLVFPVTARSAARAVTAAALRGMADVAERAFTSVLPPGGGEGSRRGAPRGGSPRARPSGGEPSAPGSPTQQQQQQQQAGEPESPIPRADGAAEQHKPAPAHLAIDVSPGGWRGSEVANGAVLTRINRPMMETYTNISTLGFLLGPLRVEYHPFQRPARFPTGPGRRAQRLARRMLNVLSCFALAMDSHHTESVPLLEPHSAELGGLVAQLREMLRALGAMVAGAVSLESAARTVAALEQHAQALMLRVLVAAPPPGLSAVDATQGLAFLAILFNVTSVARLLCLALGQSFCADDAAGQAAAAALLSAAPRWAADERLQAVAAELASEAIAAAGDLGGAVGQGADEAPAAASDDGSRHADRDVPPHAMPGPTLPSM